MNKIYNFVVLITISLFTNGVLGQQNEYLTKLIDSLDLPIDKEQRIELNLKISEEYLKSDIERSLHYANIAIAFANQTEGNVFFNDALFAKSQAFYYLMRLDSCSFYLDMILQDKDKITDRSLLGKTYLLYGGMLKDQSDFRGARTKLNRALEIQQQVKDKAGEANAYNQIASILNLQGKYDSAVFHYIKCHKLAAQIKDTLGVIKAFGNLGKTFMDLEEYERAKLYFLQALPIAIEINHLRFKALTIQNLGIIQFRLEVYDSALYYYNLAAEIYKRNSDQSSMAYLYGNIGVIYDVMSEYDTAYTYFKKALDLHIKQNNFHGVVGSKSNIALIHERKGLYKKALLMYDTVLQLAIEYQLARDIAHTYKNIYKTYELAGNFKKAFEFQSIYYQVQDSLVNLEKESAIADLELKYGKEQDQAEILLLTNETLEQNLEIKQRTNERNLYILLGIIAVVITLMIFLVTRQRMVKDRIIRMKEIDRLNEEKKAMAARALVEGQEEERKRVATELHDGLGVLLSSVKLQFTNIGEEVPEKKDLFDRATELLDKAAVDVRRISHNLMPGNLVRFGLFDALEDIFETIDESDSMKAEFRLDGKNERLPENHEVMIYRIVQELINNTIKHGNASKILLHLNHSDASINILYSDNGKGFVVKELIDTGSLGLKSIQSRIDYLEGDLEIISAKGDGASFKINLPLIKN